MCDTDKRDSMELKTTDTLINIHAEQKKEYTMPPLVRSPSLEKRIIEHRFKVQDDKYKDTWKSCCMVLDRRAVQYFTQIFIIGGCMIFSVIQLTQLTDCESQQTYMGLLTLLIGILLPNPKFNDKNND